MTTVLERASLGDEWETRMEMQVGGIAEVLECQAKQFNFFSYKKMGAIEDWQHYQSCQRKTDVVTVCMPEERSV